MKSITINNSTNKSLVVEYDNNMYSVGVNEKINIELTQSDKIRIYPRIAKSSRFVAGQFFMRDTLRNVWLFMISYIICLDSVFTIPKGVKWFDITSRDYHCLIFTVFKVLLLNGKTADSCQFRKPADKKIFLLLSYVMILPFCIGCFVILGFLIYGIIFEFSPEFIVGVLLSLLGAWITVSMLKSARRFANIADNTEKVLDENKKIVILKEKDRFLKYREYIE